MSTILKPLYDMPDIMDFWGDLDLQYPDFGAIQTFGQVALVDARPSFTEQHHEVWVMDEAGNPLGSDARDFNLVALACFLYPAGDENARFGLKLKNTRIDSTMPHVWAGNPQVVDFNGKAQHTTGQGGETIKVVVYDRLTREVVCPSPIIHGCTWADSSNLVFDVRGNRHHGVAFKFQVQRPERVHDVDPNYDLGGLS